MKLLLTPSLHVLDDEMAVKVDGDTVEFVGEGEYVTFERGRYDLEG